MPSGRSKIPRPMLRINKKIPSRKRWDFSFQKFTKFTKFTHFRVGKMLLINIINSYIYHNFRKKHTWGNRGNQRLIARNFIIPCPAGCCLTSKSNLCTGKNFFRCAGCFSLWSGRDYFIIPCPAGCCLTSKSNLCTGKINFSDAPVAFPCDPVGIILLSLALRAAV